MKSRQQQSGPISMPPLLWHQRISCLDLARAEGGMFIMIAFIIMGSLASIQLFGAGGVNAPLLYSESEKMFTRAMLYDRNIRNGVAYVLETGTCVGGNPVNANDLVGFRANLISPGDATVSRNHKTFISGAGEGLDHCLLGIDLPKNVIIESFKLDRIRAFGAIGTQFSAAVDLKINAKNTVENSSKDSPRSFEYRTLTSDQTMIFKHLTPNELGYIFQTAGETTGDITLISPGGATLEFNSPVYIHNINANDEKPITNLMKAIGREDSSSNDKEKNVFFSHPVRTNFTTISYSSYSKDIKNIPIGLARSYFSRGITTGRWTTESAIKEYIAEIDKLPSTGNTLRWASPASSDSCNKDLSVTSGSSITIKAPTSGNPPPDLRYRFCGYIVATKLTLDLSDLRPSGSTSDLIVRFDGGFIIEELEIISGDLNGSNAAPLIQFFNNQSLNTADNAAQELESVYLVSM